MKGRKSPLVVKLGGSVITEKRRPFTVRKKELTRLARELSKSNFPLVVVHGGGSFGHPLAAKYKLQEGYKHPLQREGIALTRLAMNRLNAQVVYSLYSQGIPAVAIQPSACFTVRGGKIVSANLSPIRQLLSLGLTPVLYGDVVLDLQRGISILSGDHQVVYLARKLHARRVILGVDVDGVFTHNPKLNREARLLPVISTRTRTSVFFDTDKASGDVTGGMKNKVEELLKLAKLGIESEIANALKPKVIESLVQGERGLGTIIMR